MWRCFRILRVCAQACQDLLAAFVVLVVEAWETAAPRTDMGGDGSEPSPLQSCIGMLVRPHPPPATAGRGADQSFAPRAVRAWGPMPTTRRRRGLSPVMRCP